MGQVSTKFTGDPQQLLQAYQQLYTANIKLHEQNAKLGRDSTKRHNEVMTHLTKEIGSLRSMAQGYLSIHSAIGFIEEGYKRWQDRIEQMATRAKDFNSELVRQINLAGHAANASYVESQLKHIPGAKGSDALAVYRGVTTGTDYKVDVPRQLALVRAAAPQASLGLNEADLENLGAFVGELATVNPQAAPGKLVEKSLQIQAQAGRHFDKLRSAKVGQAIRQLAAHGIPEDYAWGLAIESASQDAPQLIAQLAAAATKPFEKPDTKGRTRLTPEEAGKMRFAAAQPGEERLMLLLGDSAVARAVLPDQADLISRLDQESALNLSTSLLRGAGTSVDRRRGLAATRAGRAVMAEHEGEIAGSRALAAGGGRTIAEEYERAERILQTVMDEEGAGWLGQFYRSKAFGIDYHAGMAGLDFTKPGNLSPLMWALQLRGGSEARKRFVAETNEIEGYERYNERGELTSEALRREAEQTNELLRQIRDDNRGHGPARVNNLNER